MATQMADQQTEVDALPEERLPQLVKYHYGVTLRSGKPVGGKWQLKTDNGTYTLSRVAKMDESYWSMIERLLIHLRQNGLPMFPVLKRTTHGKLAFNGFHSRYMVWENLQAARCQWHKPATWTAIGKTLATIHRASRDFPLERPDKKFQAAGNWRTLWERNLERLDTIRAACELSTNRHPVDRLWLSAHTYTATMIETALRYLEKSGGDQEVLTQMAHGVVGQHHLRRSSWGVYAGGSYSLLDWEQTVLDVPVRDLAQMIHLASGDKQTFSQRVHLLLSGYRAIRPLEKAEWPLLYTRLLFPEHMVQTVRRLYERQGTDREDATAHLERIIADQRRREYHLQHVPLLFEQVASITIPRVDWLK